MEFGGGKAKVLKSRLEHFPAICTTKTMCHVLVRLQFRFVIIPLYQKEVMHTKETPNHHVRGAINHLPLNIKRATECPVGKQGFWKYCFPSPSPHCNKLCFYFGRGWGRARGLRNTVTNDIRFVPQAWLMPDCMHWSLPSQPSAHLLLLPKLIPWCPEKPYR